MRVAIGLKSHSGWAIAVTLGSSIASYHLIDRRRIELVEAKDVSWAKQPYHAAECLESLEAAEMVDRGIRSARNVAANKIESLVGDLRIDSHDVVACTVV